MFTNNLFASLTFTMLINLLIQLSCIILLYLFNIINNLIWLTN